MSRAVAVLRPEPGNAATVGRVEAAGLTAIRLPLFEVRAVEWAAPDPAAFDALIVTSANAARLAGPGLDSLAHLPVFAVGPATAAAARTRGLTIAVTGDGNGADVGATLAARGFNRALLLAARERHVDIGGTVAKAITVYASDPLSIDSTAIAELPGTVALLHSTRAAKRLAELVGPHRASIRLVAISEAVAAGAGTGWADIATAPAPDDIAMIALARRLAD